MASGAQRRTQALRLGALFTELEKSIQNQSCSEKELRALDHQILHLATILKVPVCTYTHLSVNIPCGIFMLYAVLSQNDLSLLRSSSSEETLAVEEVLGSFDFLSNDFNADDDTSCLGSLRLKDSG